MKHMILTRLWPAIGILLLSVLPAWAIDAATDQAGEATAAVAEAAKDSVAEEPVPKSETADAKAIPSARSPYRQLAPWIMQKVDPMRSLGETVSYHNMVEVLAVDPNLRWAKSIDFRHDVWTLEFQFKPIRMIWIDEPQAGGSMGRQLIWYIVYCVTNPGRVYHPVRDVKPEYNTFDGKQFYEVKLVDRPIQFTPEFLLDTYQRKPAGVVSNKLYPDRVIPLAMAAIRLREDPNRQFLSTVEMCREINVGETVWGIATWEGIDLETFRFSVLVSGLTNAYRWKDAPEEYKPGDPLLTGRKFSSRMLKLNFWRPADKYYEHEEEIHYGVPGGVDYQWVYR